jgi:hypothetical protein
MEVPVSSRNLSPESRERLSQAARKRWANVPPEQRRQHLAPANAANPNRLGDEPTPELELAAVQLQAPEQAKPALLDDDAILALVTTGRLLRELNERKVSERLTFKLRDGGRIRAYRSVPRYVEEE